MTPMTPTTPMSPMTPQIRVSVVGASGYSGAEVCRLLAAHEGVRLEGRYASGRSDTTGGDIAPLRIEELLDGRTECVFLATPNETSAQLAPLLVRAGIPVIDLSGAFRLKEPAAYPIWYGFEHPTPELLAEAVYGLAEWRRMPPGPSRLVANPGCYATAALLSLLPLSPFLDPGAAIVCDAKSGVTGAGRRAELAYSFAEVSGNLRPYGLGGHLHEPEIRQAAGLDDTPFLFAAHLLPVVRGLLATLYVTFRAPLSAGDMAAAYHRAYDRYGTVRLHPAGEVPEIKAVVGTPRCDIGFVLKDGGRRAIVVSAIDNLLKGAASQAVQNFNFMFGFDDEEGLR